MRQGIKRSILAIALFAAVAGGFVGHAGTAMAATSATTTESAACTSARGAYAYYKSKYDSATNKPDRMFYYNLMQEAAFDIGYYC